ncbi:MAG: hypothetical protein F6K48_20985 [Okeania sp. SIO3H1]|nr:hypothetical protein [Okeania sp. SIO3H1]
MTKILSKKKNWFEHLAEGVSDIFWGTKSARISSESMQINNENLIEYYERRDSIQQQMEAGKMQLQALMQQRNFEFQYEQSHLNRHFQGQQGELNRELQAELAIINSLFQAQEGKLNRESQAELAGLNRKFQAQEGKLNRELQAELARLNREFQAKEGKLNRENAVQLEIFRAKLQTFLQEKQKDLQFQLKEIDVALARELKAIDLQNNLTVIRQQRRLNNWPLTLDDEQIKEIVKSDNLLILFVPPILKYDRAGAGANSSPNTFPDIEQGLNRRLRAFLEKYKQSGRKVDFLTGVWMTKALSGEGAFKTVFSGLKSKPMLVINTIVERTYYHLEYSYWSQIFQEPYIDSLPKEEPLSWLELLYFAAKERLLKWEAQRNQEKIETGTTEEFDGDWGGEVVNKFLADLQLIKRENRLLERGQDPNNLPNRNYTVLDSDKETFSRLIAIQICLLIGRTADEYFLLDVPPQERQRPLLPELLPNLLEEIPSEYREKIIEYIVGFYQSLYQQLGEEESAWVPEMLIDLAISLIHLDNKFWAKEQIEKSVESWLLMRGIKSLEQVSNLEMMKYVLAPGDDEYLDRLNQCIPLLGRENYVVPAETLLNTWRKLKIKGYIRVDKHGPTLFW